METFGRESTATLAKNDINCHKTGILECEEDFETLVLRRVGRTRRANA